VGKEGALPRGKTAGLWISLLVCHLVPGLSMSGAQIPHFRGPVSWCEEGWLLLVFYLRMLWRHAFVLADNNEGSGRLRPGAHYPHVTWAHVMLLVHLGYFNIEFWRRLTLTSLCLRHVIWRGALVGSRASTPLKFLLSHTFRETCRVLFRHC
jgi:hypothetical protein